MKVINVIREVKVSYKTKPKAEPFKISDPMHVAEFCRSICPDNSREHFIALYLDGAHRVANYSLISTGSANMAMAHPREISQRAILCGSISIAVAHNHPSGVLEFSNEDIKLTKRIKEAGELLNIPLLDHVLFSDDSFISYKTEHWVYFN